MLNTSTQIFAIGLLVHMLLWTIPATCWGDESAPIAHEFGESWTWKTEPNGVRIVSIASDKPYDGRQKRLIIYATPNGSTLEQTLGCKPMEGLDWKYDIQHIAAQYRYVQSIDQVSHYVLSVVQAPALSWPEFRRSTPNANAWIVQLIESLQKQFQAEDVTLSCHSGGGSFLWGWMNASEQLPHVVSRIVFLDANYSYSDDDKHGDKLIEWLTSLDHRLMVLAYDDREIMLDGKKVIGHDGGTFRATNRMRQRLSKSLLLTEIIQGPFAIHESMDRRLRLIVHGNPENKILHTSLVGDMNGFAHAMLFGTANEAQAPIGAPRLFDAWVNSKPPIDPNRSNARVLGDQPIKPLRLPHRDANDETGSKFVLRIQSLDRQAREQEIRQAILRGNVPTRSRTLVPIRFSKNTNAAVPKDATVYVAADYLSIGSDDDCIRIPMTPACCLAIADSVDCSLLTSKLCDDIFYAATLRLPPKPLTENRDSPAAFAQHHAIIESQIHAAKKDGSNGNLAVIAGIKKDVIWTKKLLEQPHRVAIYGWHYPDGRPIQPVYAGHVDWYTDYSHGLRLIDSEVVVDEKTLKLQDVLIAPELHSLFSNEGPIDIVEIRRATNWKSSSK